MILIKNYYRNGQIEQGLSYLPISWFFYRALIDNRVLLDEDGEPELTIKERLRLLTDERGFKE